MLHAPPAAPSSSRPRPPADPALACSSPPPLPLLRFPLPPPSSNAPSFALLLLAPRLARPSIPPPSLLRPRGSFSLAAPCSHRHAFSTARVRVPTLLRPFPRRFSAHIDALCPVLPAPYSNNMLYPKEDRERKQLMYVCEFCEHTEPADDPCVSRTAIKHTAEYVCSLRQRERGRARERERERERQAGEEAVLAHGLHLLMVCTCSWCALAHGLRPLSGLRRPCGLSLFRRRALSLASPPFSSLTARPSLP